ncbi:MAG: hypothetical protein CL902_09955 [Dehalococcoidia bacterium]|nr:hypothetical protein [Dehalococcoidia bacterium]
MKHLFLVLAGLLAVMVMGCSILGGSATITHGEETSGTITDGDSDVDGWKSKAYKVDVRGGVEYFIRLTHDDSETVALWSPDADAYLALVNSEISSHTASYKFSETGSQELILRVPETQVPANYHLRCGPLAVRFS